MRRTKSQYKVTCFESEEEMGKQGQLLEDVCEEQENDTQKRSGRSLSQSEGLGKTSN